VSRIFFNEFGSIEVVAKLNRDSPNDRGEEMIGDMLLLHIELSPSFWIEMNDRQEEYVNSLFLSMLDFKI